jgi:cell fate (sporulation/competence/biofilm development) regulator YlbF (YheA/YmcA/DUF963 family)
VISYLIIAGEISFILFLLYLYARIVIKIKTYLDKKKELREYVEELSNEINKFLAKDIYGMSVLELNELKVKLKKLYTKSYDYDELSTLSSALFKKISSINKIMGEKEQKERISSLRDKEYKLKLEIEELDKEIYLKEMIAKDKIDEIARSLDIYNHPVFLKDNLNERQIVSLLENHYFKINEYCILNKKIKTFLVNPKSNHSKTHTFLVWNVRELLKSFEGVEKIREHDSIEADITFRYKSKNYALEIETGTLLGKKKQTQDKVKSLNEKYSERWFFIVSNKNLLSKYRKLGPTVQRKEVYNKLKQILR